MATNTPNLSLTLIGTGESVGTWGIPLNNNFSKIDVLAGEIISARGSESDLNARFGSVESEIGSARGVLPTLNDRLSVLLQSDGFINIANFPKSSSTAFGANKLSVPATDPQDPIVVGDNDPRVLTQSNHDQLTGGGITGLHVHNLSHIIDVAVTSAELNQAISGISANVTAGNLNILTGGGVVPKTLMTIPDAGYGYTGITELSVTPSGAPIAVGDNDPRVLTQVNHDALVTGNVTSIHGHNLVDGARDVTVTAAQLNQFTGIGSNVTASNLDQLTGGATTQLHDHDNDYYTKTQSDAQTTASQAFTNTAVATHNNDDSAHSGGNLNLGDITAISINQSSTGVSQTIRSGGAEANSQIKWEVKDQSGISKVYATAGGKLVADELETRVHTVIETTTMTQDAIATSNLTVNGNTVLGDNSAVDVLTCNVATATFNGDIVLTGSNGISLGGTINGIDVSVLSSDISLIQAEILAARNGEIDLLTNLVNMDSLASAVSAEVQGARGGEATLDARLDTIEANHLSLSNNTSNPHNVTITQAIAADIGTGITVAELETLSDGSNADALHVHSATDSAISGVLTSSVYGNFGSMSARHDALDAIVNGHTTEITNARGGELSLDARLDAVDATLSTTNSGVLTLQNEIVAARDGEATLLAKINLLETVADAANLEIVSARGVEVDLDGRFLSVEGDISLLQTEVTNARGGQASIDARLDTIEATAGGVATNASDIATLQGQTAGWDAKTDKVVHTEVADVDNTWVVDTTALGTDDVIVQCYDAAGLAITPTSIDVSVANQVTIVFGANQDGKAVIIG